MKRIAIFPVLAVLLALSIQPLVAKVQMAAESVARAQPQMEKIDPARLEAARKLLHVTTSDRLIDQMLNMAVNHVTLALVRLKPEKKKELMEIMRKIGEEMKTSGRKQELGEKIARIYARHFSTEEMNKLIAFYETPVGRKFIEKMPEIVVESQKAGMEWGRAIAEEMFRRATEEARKKGIDL